MKAKRYGDLTGTRFTRLIVTGFSHRSKENKYWKFWECLCDCGNKTTLKQCYLTSGHNKSCGCLQRENQKTVSISHGMRYAHFYGIWKGINGRCYVKSNRAYLGYGSKGITSDWRYDFSQFKRDMYESYLEHVAEHGQKQTTIDRIDNSTGYSKKNCRWATTAEQSLNRRVTRRIIIDDREFTFPELSKKFNMKLATLNSRYMRGKRGEDLVAPLQRIRL